MGIYHLQCQFEPFINDLSIELQIYLLQVYTSLIIKIKYQIQLIFYLIWHSSCFPNEEKKLHLSILILTSEAVLSFYIQWVRKVFRPPYIFHSLLYCSHLLKSFKFIFFLINVHTAPHIDRKTQNCWHFCRFIKKEKLKYHMVLSIQTLCCDTHIFNSGAVHFFWSSLRWFYTFIWVQLCLIILIGLD